VRGFSVREEEEDANLEGLASLGLGLKSVEF
jgi:hypothetical protein